MKANVREVLQKLLGKPELVEQFEEGVDAVQERATSENMVTRHDAQQKEADTEQEQCETQSGTNDDEPIKAETITTTEQMVRQSDTVVNDKQPATEQDGVSEAVVVQDLRGRVQRLEETLEGVMEAFGILSRDITMRIGRLETAETQRKAAWLADLPAYRRNKVAENSTIYRPRSDVTATTDMPASERADAILASKSKRGWGGA